MSYNNSCAFPVSSGIGPGSSFLACNTSSTAALTSATPQHILAASGGLAVSPTLPAGVYMLTGELNFAAGGGGSSTLASITLTIPNAVDTAAHYIQGVNAVNTITVATSGAVGCNVNQCFVFATAAALTVDVTAVFTTALVGVTQKLYVTRVS